MAGGNRVYATIDRIEGAIAVVSVDALRGQFNVPKRIFPGAREGRIYSTTTGRSWKRDLAAERAAVARIPQEPIYIGPGGDINLSVIRVAPT